MFLAMISALTFAPQHMGSGDAVQPRNTQSVIESISPELPDDVHVSIVGSDTYVRVQSHAHEIQVLGYEGEPYLRITKDGVVQVNDSSQTTVLNSDRYGSVDLSNFKKSSIPKWRTIATNGDAMWHDHRSHWMSPIKPGVIDDQGTVLRWVIPMYVDGTVTNIHGTLYLQSSASALWWVFVFVVGALSAWLATKKYVALKIGLLMMAALGTLVGILEYLGLPDGARITPILLMFSVGATLLCGAAIIGPRWNMKTHVAAALMAGAGGALCVAVWLCSNQIRAAYIPGLTAPWTARITLIAMAGVGVVAIVDAYMRIAQGSDGE